MVPHIPVDEYADFLAREYLSTFVCEGGAAVKFAVVADDETADALLVSVEERASRLGMRFVAVTAVDTRVNLIQQLFFAVAARLDWVSLARKVVRKIPSDVWGDQVGDAMTIAQVASVLDIDELLVRTQITKALSNRVMRDYSLAKDFRIAMTQVCLPELQPEAFTEESRASILEWLRGELRLISAVKDKHIFHKIGRHSARAMLASTSRWIAKAGECGLVLTLDLRQLALSRRPDAAEGEFYYTPAAVMDAYEVLRQFIDATDEMENFMLLVLAPDALLDDSTNRGFPKYQALKNRIWDDVRDRDRVNPYAPMVRVSSVGGGAS
ncbi:MAG: DUF2791 family P-loop domain-containing protein [Actinomycetota bacterium]|nr:DUF2791 family P-loop domain-containing protein [Actinomycetota bacterium]